MLLVVYTVAFTEGHQLLRIPFLVKHYQTHQQADPSMTLGQFLRIHYIDPATDTDDYQQDQQLPLRSMDCTVLHASLCEMHHPVLEIAPPPVAIKEFFDYHETNKPLFRAFDIFQPPRHAC